MQSAYEVQCKRRPANHISLAPVTYFTCVESDTGTMCVFGNVQSQKSQSAAAGNWNVKFSPKCASLWHTEVFLFSCE